MSIKSPLVSVILPVYNGENHLTECIESILNQTYQNFEFIIVDDASTDTTPEILNKYSDKDRRILIFTHQKNQKQTAAANTAIKNAKGPFLARMDADDVALSIRLEKQVQFMLDNPNVGLVGSWVDIIDDNGEIIKIWKTLSTNGILDWNLLFGTSFAHSSAMMRTEIVKQVGNYQSPEAEDYDLWSRISYVSNVANIQEVLQQKRVWHGQLALKVPAETRDCVIEIMQKNINALLEYDNLELEFIRKIRAVSDKAPINKDSQSIKDVWDIILKMCETFFAKKELSKIEKKHINQDTYQKLNILSNWQFSLNIIKGLYLKLYLFIRFPKFSIYRLIN